MHLARESVAPAAGVMLFGVQGRAAPAATSPDTPGKADPCPEALGVGSDHTAPARTGTSLEACASACDENISGETPSALGAVLAAGWCHLERALTPSAIYPVGCSALSHQAGRGAVPGAEPGRMSQELSLHPAAGMSGMACHPSPGPLGALHRLWKKPLPTH